MSLHGISLDFKNPGKCEGFGFNRWHDSQCSHRWQFLGFTRMYSPSNMENDQGKLSNLPHYLIPRSICKKMHLVSQLASSLTTCIQTTPEETHSRPRRAIEEQSPMGCWQGAGAVGESATMACPDSMWCMHQ